MPKIKMAKIGRKELKAAKNKAGSVVGLMAMLGKHRSCYYLYREAYKAPVDVVDQIRAYLERDEGDETDDAEIVNSEVSDSTSTVS